MEQIKKDLEEIIQQQLKECKDNKTVPSVETLNTVYAYIQLQNII